ncbi:hypothetical protein X777_09572, partial [Ooceraea biroi]
ERERGQSDDNKACATTRKQGYCQIDARAGLVQRHTFKCEKK